jgi:hypothetical protein
VAWIAVVLGVLACSSAPEPRATPPEPGNEHLAPAAAARPAPAPAAAAPTPCPTVTLGDEVPARAVADVRATADTLREVFDRLHRREDVRDVSAGGQSPDFDARESVIGETDPPDALCPVHVTAVPAELPVVRVELRRGDGESEQAPLVVRRGENGRFILELAGLAASYGARRNLRRIASLLAQSDTLPELEGVHVRRFDWPADLRPHPELTDGLSARSLARTDVVCLRFRGAWHCTEPAAQTADEVWYSDVDALALDPGAPGGTALMALARSTSSQVGEVFHEERSLVVLALEAGGARRIGHLPVMIVQRERTVRDADRYSDRTVQIAHEAYSVGSRCVELDLDDVVELRSSNGGPATRSRPRLPRAPSPWDGHDPHGEDVAFDWSGAWRVLDDGSFERVPACAPSAGG